MKKWIKAALAHKNISQAELQRRLHAKYPQSWPDGRQKINNMLAKDQNLQADEMLQISDITGYPTPDSPTHAQVTWVAKLNDAIHFAKKTGAGDEEITGIFLKHVPLPNITEDRRITLGRISAGDDDLVLQALSVLQQFADRSRTP